ncbi:MAG: hypothetical protein DRQ57_18645 [Gammaproteobacteria bacterium]|nr:MAG: hypothetical protein DRQ57_18645 [Gammaproteobacteria bacterium]
MLKQKSSFALYFGTRDIFPDALVRDARKEVSGVLEKLGHSVLMMDESATPFGAVETPAHGKVFADFLYQNKGKYDGVIVVLPNFGDENGAMAAFQDVDVPVLIMAYPDELDKMGPANRRDAFCGKFSIMDVFCQCDIKFTVLKPHTVNPSSEKFGENVDYFDRLCRVVKGTRRMRIGAIGARVTPFKTVRIDEAALQKNGITVETFDLSYVFNRMDEMEEKDVKAKVETINSLTDFSPTPTDAQKKIARLALVLDEIVEENDLDAIALRCWIELQSQLNISPCVILGEMNNRGIVAACEVDIGNAVTMHALKLASNTPAACLDWNNNYGDDENKCILFHCGPVPMDLMACKGKVTDHALIASAIGPGKSFGCNVGRIKPGPITFGSMMTQDGRLKFFLGEAKITDDPIAEDYFGCAGVAEIDNLQDVLLDIGRSGHRHHVSITAGDVAGPVKEALEYYLGFDVTIP